MKTTVLQSLNSSLHELFALDKRVFLVGEDLLDPYGGAFKVSQGLSTAFPGRVLSSPISEAGITGLAGGMALRGLRPIVEIMFGDFSTLILDQVVNHLAKFHDMYNGQAHAPVVIRLPMGGRRGYGATHSQTLDKMFLGVPGITVLAPCALNTPYTYGPLQRQDLPGALLAEAVLGDEQNRKGPVVFIENKLLYTRLLQSESTLPDFQIQVTSPSRPPAFTFRLKNTPPPRLTIAAYGYMAELAREAVLQLAYEYELFAELVIFTQLAPFDISPLLASLKQTHHLLTVEEGTGTLGWGAEILALAHEALPGPSLRAGRVAALDRAVPASRPLEETVLPGTSDIVRAALEVIA